MKIFSSKRGQDLIKLVTSYQIREILAMNIDGEHVVGANKGE